MGSGFGIEVGVRVGVRVGIELRVKHPRSMLEHPCMRFGIGVGRGGGETDQGLGVEKSSERHKHALSSRLDYD